jgi:Tol biopolymer transport system component
MSITPAGFAGNGGSFNPAVSADAMVVAFRSEASDLIAGDDNGRWDIFVRDRAAATTTRISVASDGTQADHHSSEASISDDGRFVAFRSLATNLVPGDTNGRADIFVHDRATGQTVRVSQPAVGESDGNSAAPAISGNGAWIVFESDATNLVAGDTNAARDIFRAANPMAAGNRGGR